MKKFILFSFIVVLLLSLTACVNQEEKAKGEQNVKEGKKLIKEYVMETYGKKAKVSDFKSCYVNETHGDAIPKVIKNASDFVKATVTTRDNKFDIIYNIYTDEVFSKENISVVEDSFLEYANDKLKGANLINCELELYSKNEEDHYIFGFIKPNIISYEELMASGEYGIKLTFSSIDSDFNNINKEEWNLIKLFLAGNTDDSMLILYVNYNNKEEYEEYSILNYFNKIVYSYTGPESDNLQYSISEEALTNTKNIIYVDEDENVITLK